MKYKIISSVKQYKEYCSILEDLVSYKSPGKRIKDEIALLTLLIETWDKEHLPSMKIDPISMLVGLMADHQLKSKDLSIILGISKGYVSDILHYKKGLSKDVIRKLAAHFKLSQEAFNRPYKLFTNHLQSGSRTASKTPARA